MCMTEPLLWFSPSLHTSLQVLRRSLKPTVKLLSVQAAYKEFIQNLHFIFLKRLNGCEAGLFLIALVRDMFETTLTDINQCCAHSNSKHPIMDHNYPSWHGVIEYRYPFQIYTIITLQGKSKT